jgi:hypothetical protein
MSIRTVIRQQTGVATVVTAGSVSHALAASGAVVRVAVTTVAMGIRGEQGVPGQSGSAASLSADAGNRSTVGSDGGIHTPDLTADPLAYYILAKT